MTSAPLYHSLNEHALLYDKHPYHSSFSQTHIGGNVGFIANFVFPYICSFLLYSHQVMLINVILEIKGFMRISFQGHTFYLIS